MYEERWYLTTFCKISTIAAIVALILTGCSADNRLRTESVQAVALAEAMPGATLTPPPAVKPSPTSTALLEETAVDGLNTTKEEPVEPFSATTTDGNNGQTGEDLLGIQVYRENFCGTCHELAAAQTAGAFGPTHSEAGSLAETRVRDANYTGNATTAADYIRESLLDPTVYLVPGYEVTYMKMPPFTHLKPEEIDALVTFLLDQK